MQALGIMAQPQNVPVALRQLAMMVDDIWQHAGDASTDHNWYTKRAILAGVYTATGEKSRVVHPGARPCLGAVSISLKAASA